MAAHVVNDFFRSFESHLEAPVRLHLKNVYAALALTCASAVAGVFLDMFTFIRAGLLSGFAGIGMTLLLLGTHDNGKNRVQRLCYLLSIGLFTGMGLGPLLSTVIAIDPSIVLTALLGSTMVFVCFSLASMLAKRGSYLYIGGPLMTLLSTVSILGLVSIFFPYNILFQAYLYVGLFVMCGFVVYDTQMIIEKRRRGNTDFIAHALDLFIDFYGIFKRLLVILTEKSEQDRRRRRD